jgi:hypothetical protein
MLYLVREYRDFPKGCQQKPLIFNFKCPKFPPRQASYLAGQANLNFSLFLIPYTLHPTPYTLYLSVIYTLQLLYRWVISQKERVTCPYGG